jgi:hypothetical protein
LLRLRLLQVLEGSILDQGALSFLANPNRAIEGLPASKGEEEVLEEVAPAVPVLREVPVVRAVVDLFTWVTAGILPILAELRGLRIY